MMRLDAVQRWPSGRRHRRAQSRLRGRDRRRGARPADSCRPSRLYARLACRAGADFAPTACEPVNEMPSMPGWSTIAAPTPPVPSTRLNTPAGAPHSWMIEASACAIAGVTLAGFMTTQLPNASAGADFHAGIAIRKFPRRDQAENTDRLAAGRNVNAGTGRFERLAVTAQRLTREVLEYACGAHDLAGRLGQRLAFLARQQFAERLGTRHDGCADLVEQVGPYLGRGRGPCRERGARCLEPRGRPRRHRRSGSSRRSHACRTG